jgi:RNA ligase
MFPEIKTFADLKPKLNEKFNIHERDKGYATVVYGIQDDEVFDGPDEAYLRECRGIMFDGERDDSKLICRPLHKFFNVGERSDTLPSAIDWSRVNKVGVKRDGSMITPFIDPATYELRCKTKKSSATKEAAAALNLLLNNQRQHQWVVNLIEVGYTPIFEITSPRFPIVVLYEQEELTLLQVRHMEQGVYLTDAEIAALNPPFPVVPDVASQFLDRDGHVSWPLIHKACQETHGMEGWIIQTSRDMYKAKTQWYMDLHHSVTFIRWRDVARCVLSNSADDLKANFRMTGRDVVPIELVQAYLKEELEYVQGKVNFEVQFARDAGLSFKDMAGSLRSHPYFNLIMATSRGQNVDYNEWYQRRRLSDWSLEVITTEVKFIEPLARERP